jgi:putative ABC transport system substrate-binding protein
VKRRAFITLLGGAAAWPLPARAQQPKLVIGWLYSVSAETAQPTLAAFRKALGDAGYGEDRNVQFEYRWAEGKDDRLPAMAAELVARRVTLIVTRRQSHDCQSARARSPAQPARARQRGDRVRRTCVCY